MQVENKQINMDNRYFIKKLKITELMNKLKKRLSS